MCALPITRKLLAFLNQAEDGIRVFHVSGVQTCALPTSREDLVELLRDVQTDGLIGPDTLRMMEGAIAIAGMTVGDVMVSRAQMVALPADGEFLDLMKQVVESGHSRFPVHGEDKDEILG